MRRRRTLCLALASIVMASACTPPQGQIPAPECRAGVVTFRFHAPGARVVQVSGSWDSNTFLRGRDWTSDTTVGRMADTDHDGTWTLEVPLGPGRYEYLMRVDGRFWQLDPSNPQRVADGEGGERSLLIVP